jgi:hypothetical protein
MPKQERFKADYPGVSFILGTVVATGKPERIYFIRYRRDGKLVSMLDVVEDLAGEAETAIDLCKAMSDSAEAPQPLPATTHMVACPPRGGGAAFAPC